MYTFDEIIHLTGIPENKATEVCRMLCNEGYLIFNEKTGKYRLTNDSQLLERIRNVGQQMSNEYTARQICSKIQDIMTLGKPLALSERSLGFSVPDIGIPGLNVIFSAFERKIDHGLQDVELKKTPGLPRGHCILIKGEPGTGKTTLGMQIAHYLEKAKYRSLFLTFEENIKQLCNNLDVYCRKDEPPGLGWDKALIKKVTRSISKIQTPTAWEDPGAVIQELCAVLDKEMPQLVVIDSISRFRDIGGETKARLVLRRLIRILKIRNITSIFLGEDRGESNAFEEYETDGIIHLKWIRDQLSLSVTKMRGLRAYKGPHSAALLALVDFSEETPEHHFISEKHYVGQPKIPHLKVGFNVFPEISVYNDVAGEQMQEKNSRDEKKAINTGTRGLDDLLPLGPHYDPLKGFKKGETVLIIGSAGSGKTLLALNFMLDGYRKESKKESTGQKKKETAKEDKKRKIAVWINLEGDIGTLKFATAGFEGEFKDDLTSMIEHAEKQKGEQKGEQEKDKEYFKFFNFPPINLDLNKIIYTLEAIHRSKKYTIDRLVIDSITELERAKGGGQPEVKSFLAGLIQFLRDRNITTIFISRSDTFFRSIDKIEEQISSLVDLIICIRNFDMHNQITRGVYIQKARGRTHDSRITRMTIDPHTGIKIEDSGWDVEYLLAGDTGSIQGPRVFFKLFYENPAEKEINEAIIKDFDEERYPGVGPSFSLVRKTSIHTEFWSFRGQYSAGHANTRVLSIADHVLSAFRDNNRLTELKDYVKNELLQNIQRDIHLIRIFNPPEDKLEKEYEPEQYIIDAIPCYRDYGVMVFNQVGQMGNQEYLDFIKQYVSLPSVMNDIKKYKDDSDWLKENSEGGKNGLGEVKKSPKGYTWDNLLKLIKKYNEDKEMKGFKAKEPFAFPSLENKSEFIAFFMELLWSHGGDIYQLPIRPKYKITGFRNSFREIIKKRIIYELRQCKKYLKSYKDPENQKSPHDQGTNEKDEKKIKFIKSLFNLPKNVSAKYCSDMYTQIENRFKKYGIGQGYVTFDVFLEWIDDNIPGGKDIEKINVLNLDDESFIDTIKLMMRLIHEAGVPNPIHGDFRDQAILSRHWYSNLSSTHVWDRKLLPLPLARIEIDENSNKGYYRSVTCTTYWCLALLKDALSPEIGGNFIESMNSPDYYVRRLRMRAGMPSMNWELDKKEFIKFDPDSYYILNRIVDNGMKYEELRIAISENIKEMDTKSSIILSENDYAFVGKTMFEPENEKIQTVDYWKGTKDEGEINKRMFYPKWRQTRVPFYQIEQALHYQIRQILIPDPKREDVVFLKGIYKEIRDLCKDTNKNENEKKKEWKKILSAFICELKLHIILELLMYFYHQAELKGR